MSALSRPMADWTPEEEEAMRHIAGAVLTYGDQEMKDAQLVLDHLSQIAMQKKLDTANEAYLKAGDKQVAGTHYKDMGVEPWDVVDTWPLEQRIGAYRHGALKYLMRMGSKDEQLQEIKKCGHYIEKLIEVLESEK